MGRRPLRLALLAALGLALPAPVGALLATSPASATLARGQSSPLTIQYRFTAVAAAATVTSASGTFSSPAGVLATNPVPLTVALTGGAGLATETVVVPAGVVEQLAGLGPRTVTYRRTFSNGDLAVVTLTAGSGATASFGVVRVDLAFEGGRAEVTVPRHAAGLRAAADVRFTGTGLLEGWWEVDGRMLARVSQLASFGGAVTVATPAAPPLPTAEPGVHVLRLVLTGPGAALAPPAVLYFVTGGEAPARPASLRLRLPLAEAPLAAAEARFEWEAAPGAAAYLLALTDCASPEVRLSAFTRLPAYQAPARLLAERLGAARRACWKVTAYDEAGRISAESEARPVALPAAAPPRPR